MATNEKLSLLRNRTHKCIGAHGLLTESKCKGQKMLGNIIVVAIICGLIDYVICC